jgi:hypothetical protein
VESVAFPFRFGWKSKRVKSSAGEFTRSSLQKLSTTVAKKGIPPKCTDFAKKLDKMLGLLQTVKGSKNGEKSNSCNAAGNVGHQPAKTKASSSTQAIGK